MTSFYVMTWKCILYKIKINCFPTQSRCCFSFNVMPEPNGTRTTERSNRDPKPDTLHASYAVLKLLNILRVVLSHQKTLMLLRASWPLTCFEPDFPESRSFSSLIKCMRTLNYDCVATLWQFNVFLTLIFAEHTAFRWERRCKHVGGSVA